MRQMWCFIINLEYELKLKWIFPFVFGGGGVVVIVMSCATLVIHYGSFISQCNLFELDDAS